jgi:hypothetical protein
MKIAPIIVLIVLTQTLFAQINSPYSKYGIGQLEPSTFCNTNAMGGTATAFQAINQLNPYNPASYSALRYVTFDFALTNHFLTAQSKSASSKNYEATPAYLGLGMPLINKEKTRWGLFFGLLPYSRVSYLLQNQINPLTNNGINQISYVGSGRTYQFMIGNSIKYKNFYLGANLGYLFGRVGYFTEIAFPDSAAILNTSKDNSIFHNGFITKVGAQYDVKINEKSKIVLGAQYQLKANINDKLTSTVYSSNNVGTPIDTTYFVSDSSTQTRLPSSFAVGLHYSFQSNLRIGVDYKATQWNNFLHLGQQDSVVNNWQIAVGAQFVPISKGGNYLSSCYYRLGFYYGTDYIKLKNIVLPDAGITAGIGFPIRLVVYGRYLPIYINTALVAGTRGTTNNSLIKENYTKFQVGVTLNDVWFQRAKFD